MESSGISPMGVPPPPPDLIRVFEDFRPTVSLSLRPNLASERDFLRPRKTLTKSMATYLTPKCGRHLPRKLRWEQRGSCNSHNFHHHFSFDCSPPMPTLIKRIILTVTEPL